MEREIGDVVEMPDCLLSHRVVGTGLMNSKMDSPPVKPLQYLHRRRITESLIQGIPVIQQRPLTSPPLEVALLLLVLLPKTSLLAVPPIHIQPYRRGQISKFLILGRN